MDDYRHISVSRIDDTMTVYNEENKVWQITEREWYGLSFCRSGELTYTHNGKKYVSKAGTAVFLPKGGTYLLTCLKPGEFPLINFQLEGDSMPDSLLCIPVPEGSTWESDYEAMEQLAMRPEQNQFALKSLLYRMLDQLLADIDRNYMPAVLYTGLKFLEENIADATLSNGVIAAHAGVSEVYMRQLFARYLGQSPRQYLLQRRLDIARILLRNPNILIGKVAENCGFSSIYHFSRAFHTAEGCSPSAYRATHPAQMY